MKKQQEQQQLDETLGRRERTAPKPGAEVKQGASGLAGRHEDDAIATKPKAFGQGMVG